MSSVYYKFLLEEQKEFNRETYHEFNIDKLSIEDQIKYIKWYMLDLQIPVTIRPSDSRNKYFYVVFQNEDQLELAVNRFAGVSGAEQHGDKFLIGDSIYKFDYDFNKRVPLDQSGERVEDRESRYSGLAKLANMFRRETQMGRRLYKLISKSNLKSLNPDF